MCSYTICEHIKIGLCKQIFKCEKSLHFLSVFRPFTLPQKEFKIAFLATLTSKSFSNRSKRFKKKQQQKCAAWMLLIFRKCRLCIILNMLLMFCQILGSCFDEKEHCKALFLKTFSLIVFLNCDKLQVISAET